MSPKNSQTGDEAVGAAGTVEAHSNDLVGEIESGKSGENK